MNPREPNGAELRQMHDVAAEYRRDGYRVIISPAPDDLPAFLRGSDIDLLVKNGDESVVVQVRSRETLAHSREIADLARLLEGKNGWRLELVVAAGPSGNGESDELQPSGAKVLSGEEIQDRLAEASELSRRGHEDAAFLLGWSAAEAAMRAAIASAGLAVDRPTPLSLMKTLYSYGLISKGDYDLLLKCSRIRSAIVHGFKPVKSGRRPVGGLLECIERLTRIEARVES